MEIENWHEKIANEGFVKATLGNLTEGQVAEFGVEKLYDLLKARFEVLKRDKFQNIDAAELQGIKNELINFKDMDMLTASGVLSRVNDINDKIEDRYVNKEKVGEEQEATEENAEARGGMGGVTNEEVVERCLANAEKYAIKSEAYRGVATEYANREPHEVCDRAEVDARYTATHDGIQNFVEQERGAASFQERCKADMKEFGGLMAKWNAMTPEEQHAWSEENNRRLDAEAKAREEAWLESNKGKTHADYKKHEAMGVEERLKKDEQERLARQQRAREQMDKEIYGDGPRDWRDYLK